MKAFVSIIFIIFLLSCEGQEEDKTITRDENLLGEWLLFETGYSPGSGYINVPVPANPPQTLSLNASGQLTSNISNLSEFKFYQVLTDTTGTQDQKVLALFKSYPGSVAKNVSELEVSYTIDFKDGNLFLYYRWCIEGCHLAFRKITSSQD